MKMLRLSLLLFSLVVLLMPVMILTGETGGNEELPAVVIEAKPKVTTFQDLYSLFKDNLDEQGYVYVEDLSLRRAHLSFAWNIDFEDEWQSEGVLLSDDFDQPTDEKIPLAERLMAVTHTASTTDDPKELFQFENFMTRNLDMQDLDLDTWFEAGMEEQIKSHSIDKTSSALSYTYNMGTLHAEEGEFDFHTLETKLSPLAYEEDNLFEALPKLADYLYESRPSLEDESSTILITALVTEETSLTEDVILHSVQWSRSSQSDRTFVRHMIEFDRDISEEDATAVLAHLEKNSPSEVKGLAKLWREALSREGTGELFGEGWSARARTTGQKGSFVLDYKLDKP